MRQSKVKKIRKKVYGDYSQRNTQYVRDISTDQIRCYGLRAKYKKEKKQVKDGNTTET